jgi:Mrp family chromosome partitioning ATPase
MSATQQGRKVIVIDCDLRHRALTRALNTRPEEGVLEACDHPYDWSRYTFEEPETGLMFMPAAPAANAWRTLTNANGFSALLDRLDEEFDLIVLDCPPALTTADGMVIARRAELAVVVATWDRTRLNALRAVMRRMRTGNRPTTGVYVNRVPPGYRFGRLRPD